MDFKEMCEIEPRLKELEADIVAFRATKRRLGSCVLQDWYRLFKPRLMKLVGWESKGELVSADCYDVAYRHLCDLLMNRRKKPFVSVYDGKTVQQIRARMTLGAIDGE